MDGWFGAALEPEAVPSSLAHVHDQRRPEAGHAGAAAAAYVFGYPLLEARLFKTEVALTEISMVSPAQASITVTSTGYVVPQRISKVGAKVAGRVAKVHIKEGSTVKAGDVLAELEPTTQQSSVAAATSRALAAQTRELLVRA